MLFLLWVLFLLGVFGPHEDREETETEYRLRRYDEDGY
jgi:hypothetical protein